VTAEGWRLFNERLRRAERALTAAWAADPGCAGAAAEMITVCMGLGHDRETMDLWFRRAMEADGDCLAACEKKLACLMPKWGGSVKEMVQFGRQCRDTNNWAAGLPLILVAAHRDLAQASGAHREHYRSP